MRKFTQILIMITSLMIFSNCSSDSREETPTEKQDFTNATFIKNTMLGQWVRTHSKDVGNWQQDFDLPNTPHAESTYQFNADNTYSYKPYSSIDMNQLNESGTYEIKPATSTMNAKIKFNYKLWDKPQTREVILTSYNDGIVETSSLSLSTTGGILYERFKKK